MMFFFELRKNKAGFSRIGRIKLHQSSEDYIYTPNILIPLNDVLMRNFNFIEEFGCFSSFIIKSEKYLKKEYVEQRFRDNNFFFSHSGTLEAFKNELKRFKTEFTNNSVFPVIPFQVPTTSIGVEFATQEIENYLSSVKVLLQDYSDFNFGLSIRYFNHPELIDRYFNLISEFNNIKLLNLNDLFDNFSNFRNIIEIIEKVKSNLDNNLVLMASGKIIPQYFPILTYLGIDIIDSSYLLYLSAENLYNAGEYLLPLYKLKYPSCNCLSCKEELRNMCGKKQSPQTLDALTFHNLISTKNYMNKIKQYLHSEDFRALVEKSSLNDTYIISLLKVLDKKKFDLIKSYSKLIQKNKQINCLGESSFYRPDFVRYRRKVVDNFIPESFTELIILLPCSAKKPYSESKSHRKFNSILRKFSEFPSFQEFIVTSPLGVVPRQLENIYPVNSYNISVTGDWSQEEIEISGGMLLELLKKYDENIPIICHLDGEYKAITNYVNQKIGRKFSFSKIKGRPTNRESLNALEDLIKHEIRQEREKILPQNENFTRIWYRKFIKIIDYQFGKGFGEKLMEQCNYIKKNFRHSIIELYESKNQNKLGSFKLSNGYLYLTINGAQKIAHQSDFSKFIVFDGESLRGNTLFRPGVKSFHKDLLPDDPVVIFNSNKDKILGTGKMVVGSKFIQNSKSGRIAKIYESQ